MKSIFLIFLVNILHEWALAEGIVKTILIFLGETGAKKPEKVVVSIGELQQIDLDAFKLALSELKKESGLENVKFEFVEEEVYFRCETCGYEWALDEMKENLTDDISEAIHFLPELSHGFFRCPRCGSKDFEIVKGRGVRIREIVFG